MTAAFFVILAIAVVLAAVLVVRERSRQPALEKARQDAAAASERADEAERLRADTETSVGRQLAAAAATQAELEATTNEQVASAEARVAELRATSRNRIEALERNLRDAESERRRLTDDAAASTAATETAVARVAGLEASVTTADTRTAALLAELTEMQEREAPHTDAGAGSADPVVPDAVVPVPVAVSPAEAASSAPGAGGGLSRDAAWQLLLARVERQWADVVNAGVDERGVVDGPRSEQLAQAVQRDLERLREEVGVEATIDLTESMADDDPLTTLLAVGEAVALLAYHSEHVRVALRDPTIVSGQDWTGDDEAKRTLEQFVAKASESGMRATVDVLDHAAQVVLGLPRDDGSSSS